MSTLLQHAPMKQWDNDKSYLNKRLTRWIHQLAASNSMARRLLLTIIHLLQLLNDLYVKTMRINVPSSKTRWNSLNVAGILMLDHLNGIILKIDGA